MTAKKGEKPSLIKPIFLTIIALWIVSNSTMVVAYLLPTSMVWRSTFGEFGWVLELIRGSLVALGTAAVLIQVFPYETNRFFRVQRQKPTFLRWIRAGAIVLAALATVIAFYHHLYIGPRYLANPASFASNLPDLHELTQTTIPLRSPEYFQEYCLPYLWYLPYSLVNFVCLGIPAVAVGLYASIKNLVIVHNAKKDLITSFRNARKEQDSKEVQRQFELFCINFIDIIGKYSALFLIMTVMIVFEYRIGYITQSTIGRIWTWIGYTFASSALLAIFIGFSHYADAFQHCSRQLVRIEGEVADFESKHSVPRILNRILIRHLSLYLTLALLLATFTFLSPLGKLFGFSL